MISLGRYLACAFCWACVLLLPQIIFVLLEQSSLAIGTVISSFIVTLLSLTGVGPVVVNISILKKTLLLLGWILFTSAISLYFYSDVKPIFSVLLLALHITFCYMISERLKLIDVGTVRRSVQPVFFLLLIFGALELSVGFYPLKYANLHKPLFPFSEHSHYALALCLTGCLGFYRSAPIAKIIVALSCLVIGVLLPSLATVAAAAIMGVTFLDSNNLGASRKKSTTALYGKIFTLVAIGLAVAAYLGGLLVVPEYFSDRLSIGEEPKNLTTLVFLQGIEQAYLSFSANYGFGISFQRLGTEGGGYFSDRILTLFGKEYNRYDGGFLAAKLVAEFGVLGLLMLMFYIYKLYCFYFHKGSDKSARDSYKRFFDYCLVAFSLEFFLRGYGYFSPGLTVLIVFWLRCNSERFGSRGNGELCRATL